MLIIVGFIVFVFILCAIAFESRLGDIMPSIIPVTQRMLWSSFTVGIILVFINLFQGDVTWYKVLLFLIFILALIGLIRNKIFALRDNKTSDDYAELRALPYRFLYYSCWNYAVFYIMLANAVIAVTNSSLVE